MDKYEIIDRISAFRTEKKMSARTLSLESDLSETYISRLEQGNSFLPSMEALLNIITLGLKITPEEFFYSDFRAYKKDKEIIDLLNVATLERKEAALTILKLK